MDFLRNFQVGNANFDTYFNSKVSHMWRSINQNDPVPHLPPTVLGKRYFWGPIIEFYQDSNIPQLKFGILTM